MENPDESPLTRERPAGNRAVRLGPPSLPDLFLSFLRLGAVSFGGPAMVAYIGRLAVARKGWLSDNDFKSGIVLSQTIPGAAAMQCAAYVGLRTRGLPGAAVAYLGFGLPAFVLMLALSIAYWRAHDVRAVTTALTGLRVLVVALVANGAWGFGRKSIKALREILFSAGIAILFLFGASPFLIVLSSGALGMLLFRSVPSAGALAGVPRPRLALLRSSIVLPLLAAAFLAMLFVVNHRLAELGLVMMKIDTFAFGGGFASIPLMLREIVDARRWIPASTFMDGIALGKVTPGPIVITATFVGYAVGGLAGALTATVCVFLPSLIVLVLVEPWFRWLQTSALFRSSVMAVLLSFVGLLVSVTIRFALVAPWSIPSGILAAAALEALLLGVEVVWVVLGGAVLSAVVL